MHKLIRKWMRTSTAICLIAGSLRLACAADFDEPLQFNIAANTPLDDALIQWSTLTHLQIMLATHAADKKLTDGAKGLLSPRKALDALLERSGLTYFIEGNHTVTVAPSDLHRAAMMSASGPSKSNPPDPAPAPEVSVPGAPTPTDNSDAVGQSENAPPRLSLQEVVVTGTHIAGGPPPGSALITITRDDIESSGYSTIGDVIRSLPQSFGGGINPGVIGTTAIDAAQNVSSASTVNLRGLGSDSTLTLVNGHRLAYDGYTSSVDISVIPLAAIERVEILTDSASSIYGSDAVAGVANFILKQDFSGADTSARVGGSSRGGGTERQASQLFGTRWSTGHAMLSYEYYNQDQLLAQQRAFSSGALNPQTLLPFQKRNSVFASIYQNLGERVQAHMDGLYSDRRADALASYYSTDTDTRLFGVSPGLRMALPNDWSVSLDGTLSRSRNNQITYTPDYSPFYYANQSTSVEGTASGSVLKLPTGTWKLAAGVGYRKEGYQDESGIFANRHIDFGFAELRVPLAEAGRAHWGLEKLELSISGRYEHYSDFGNATTPKLGLVYSPAADVAIRGSWGKAFRAPDLQLQYGQTQLIAIPALLGGLSSPADAQLLDQTGSNPRLGPETAHTWSAGLDWMPDRVKNLKVSISYFDIDYRQRITIPINNLADALVSPLYSPFLTRNPSAAEQAALIAQSTVFEDFTGAIDPTQSYNPDKVVAVLRDQYQNIAVQASRGVDATGEYHFDTAVGSLGISMNTAWLRTREILTPRSPALTLSGTVFNAPRFKARAGAVWQLNSVSASSFINYVSSENDNTLAEPVHVGSWSTVDAQIAYDASRWGGPLEGARAYIVASNLFNRNPPFVGLTSTFIGGLGYDSANASPLGRFVSVGLEKKW